MSQLERRLNLRLLRRDSSGTRLTPAGERIATLARRVLDEVHVMLSAAEALRATERSHLRVAASLTVAEHLLPAWIGALHQVAPQASLTLEVTNSATVLTRLADGLVDLGFVEGTEEKWPDMDSTVMAGDRLLVVVSPDHPWASQTAPVTGEQLACAELVIREEGSGTRQVLEAALAPWGGLRTRLELGSISAVLAAVRHGEGPAVLSVLAVAQDLHAGTLVTVETDGVDLSRDLQAVWSTVRPLAPLARAILEIAQA